MGTFYTVDAEFWTDPDVVDNLTPEDKYFYLYLLTNPHGNCSGCFQISMKQIADELGYSRETVERLIERFVSIHKMIDYDAENKEILIHKWGKRHWTKSDKYISAVKKKIDAIKTKRFREYLSILQDAFVNSDDMVWIGYQYPNDSLICPISYNPLPITDNDIDNEKKIEESDELDVDEFIKEWNGVGLGQLRDIRKKSERWKMTKARVNEYGADVFVDTIRKVGKSDFLKGKNNHGWVATYDWLVKPNNFIKVLEGNYENRGSVGSKTFLDMYKEEYGDGKGKSSEAVVSY